MPKQPSRGVVTVFLGLFIVIGAVAFAVGVWNLVRSIRCESWPTAEGTVDRAEMTYHSSKHGGTYSADISYHYQAAGAYYSGKRLAFGSMSSSSSYARGILARYPVGAKVQVHYSPDDPELAVLETGIHGGTWICLGVGTVFMLAGIMFLQIVRKALSESQYTYAPANTVQNPPALMGVIFVVMGSLVFFMTPSAGASRWVVYDAGGMFVLAGLCLLASRLQNKLPAKMFGAAAGLAFLAVFHWVAFGPGERTGTVSTPFFVTHGVNVKTVFAIATVLMDIIIMAVLARRLLKGSKN
jgi:Protein of unknown function (DUF3592)